jgi:hypothetical protein
MHRLQRSLVSAAFAALLFVCLPCPCSAQAPRYAASAAVGVGGFVAGKPYDAGWLFSANVSVARWFAGRTALSVEGHVLSGPAAEEGFVYPDGNLPPTTLARPTRTLPTTYGAAATVWRGIAREARIGAGAGGYHVETRGGAPGGTGAGLHLAAERTIARARRGVLAVGTRIVYLPNIGGTSAWFLPVSVAVRTW